MAPLRYRVFISYNHRDREFARWLHRNLETFKPHRFAREEMGQSRTLSPVFMDREELASSGDLAASVVLALEAADNLVVVCSPNAAQSIWVNEEVKTFQRLGRHTNIFCIIASGDPSVLPRTPSEIGVGCFPIALLFDEKGKRRPEPLAADSRAQADGKEAAKLKIIAGLLQVPYDLLRQREANRKQKRLAIIATATTIGLVITSGLALSAWLSRNEAERQRLLAEQKSTTAYRTVGFLKSMFANADPTQARGDKLTVRELVDRAAVRIELELESEHEVRSELMKTLGEVYGGLGNYSKGASLIESARAKTVLGTVSRANQDIALADIRNFEGQYKEAIQLYNSAIEVLGSKNRKPVRELFSAYTGLGNAFSAIGDHQASRDTLQKALLITPSHSEFTESRLALEFALATSEYYAGNRNKTKQLLIKTLNSRIEFSGESHPHALWMLNLLGVIALADNDALGAEVFFKRTIAVEEKVFGGSHPTVASSRANLARLQLEQRRFTSAAPVLSESVATLTTQLAPDHDDLAFVYANLAIAQRGLHDDKSAEANFLKALPIARKHNHRTLPQTLVDIAEIECRTKRADSGWERLLEAEPLMKKTYPSEAWRAAYVEQIRGACLTAQGKHSEGLLLLESSTPVLVARWGNDGLYGFEARERLLAAQKQRSKQK